MNGHEGSKGKATMLGSAGYVNNGVGQQRLTAAATSAARGVVCSQPNHSSLSALFRSTIVFNYQAHNFHRMHMSTITIVL